MGSGCNLGSSLLLDGEDLFGGPLKGGTILSTPSLPLTILDLVVAYELVIE